MRMRIDSEYNLNAWTAFRAILDVLRDSDPRDDAELRAQITEYLAFRRSVDEYNNRYYVNFCDGMCFKTGLSACCGFESIITFFADYAISALVTPAEEIEGMLRLLERPNNTQKCVFLGPNGCILRVSPITCAMYFCDDAKQRIFEEHPEARDRLEELRLREKDFTWPDKLVLFDELERFFLERGADSPLMYCHKSPGLLRVKKKAGLGG